MSLIGHITEAAAALAPRLSFSAASGLGRRLGSLAWALDARHRRVAECNLGIAFPGLPSSRRRDIGRRAFQQAGRDVIETLWSAALDERSLGGVGAFEGLHHIEEAHAGGRGVVLTTAHFGNWEMMGMALALVGWPISVIARPIADPALEAVLLELRTRTGNRVIHKEDAVRASLRALRAGEAVGILMDQNTLRDQATFVPFFGRLAATTRLTAQLHLRTGAPILMMFSVPAGEGYRFVVEPLALPPEDAAGGDRVQAVTGAATAHIEAWVRRRPEAWLWIHDRWRTRPGAASAPDDRAAPEPGAAWRRGTGPEPAPEAPAG